MIPRKRGHSLQWYILYTIYCNAGHTLMTPWRLSSETRALIGASPIVRPVGSAHIGARSCITARLSARWDSVKADPDADLLFFVFRTNGGGGGGGVGDVGEEDGQGFRLTIRTSDKVGTPKPVKLLQIGRRRAEAGLWPPSCSRQAQIWTRAEIMQTAHANFPALQSSCR